MSNLVNNVRSLASVLTLAGLLAIAGCANTNKECCTDGAKADSKAAATTTAAAPARNAEGRIITVNSLCPIGEDDFGSKDRPDALARTYNGQSIGFCCDHCVTKFDKMDDAHKSGVLKAAQANAAVK